MAQAIFFAFGLILPVFYDPEQFGAFAVLMTTVNVFAIVAAVRMDVLLMLPRQKAEAQQLFLLGLRFVWVASFFFVLSAPIFFYFRLVPNIGQALLYVSIASFFGFFSLFRSYLLKLNWLKQYARWSVVFALIVSLSQVVFYFIGIKAGLIFGYGMGLVGVSFWMAYKIYQEQDFHLDRQQANTIFKRYSSIVRYAYPSGVLNAVALNILPVIITGIFSLKVAGLYFLANTLLNKPISVLSGSIGQSYYKTAVNLMSKSNLRRLTKYTLLATGGLVIVLLSVSLLTVKYILIPWYGDQWNLVISYMNWLLPFVLMKALFNPISSLAEILDKTKMELFFSISMILIIIVAAYWGNRSGEILVFIKWYALLGALAYLSLLLFFANLLLKSSDNE